jgi:hypothetical protein
MRDLKVFGAVLMGALAIGVALAAMAVADTFRVENNGSITLTGAQKTTNVFTYPGIGNTECEEVTFTATTSSGTILQTVTPTFASCETAGISSTVTPSGCTYRFYVNALAGNTTGVTDIVCPEGKKLKIVSTIAGVVKCTIEIGAQSALSAITYKNIGFETTREIEASLALKGIAATAVAGTGIGKCTSGTTTSATNTGTILFTGEKDGGTTHVGWFLE